VAESLKNSATIIRNLLRIRSVIDKAYTAGFLIGVVTARFTENMLKDEGKFYSVYAILSEIGIHYFNPNHIYFTDDIVKMIPPFLASLEEKLHKKQICLIGRNATDGISMMLTGYKAILVKSNDAYIDVIDAYIDETLAVSWPVATPDANEILDYLRMSMTNELIEHAKRIFSYIAKNTEGECLSNHHKKHDLFLNELIDQRNFEVAGCLVEQGINVNAISSSGRTMLCELLEYVSSIRRDYDPNTDSCFKLFELLINKGANLKGTMLYANWDASFYSAYLQLILKAGGGLYTNNIDVFLHVSAAKNFGVIDTKNMLLISEFISKGFHGFKGAICSIDQFKQALLYGKLSYLEIVRLHKTCEDILEDDAEQLIIKELKEHLSDAMVGRNCSARHFLPPRSDSDKIKTQPISSNRLKATFDSS